MTIEEAWEAKEQHDQVDKPWTRHRDNDGEWRDRIIYWGPMGCLTGFYLLVRGDLSSKDMVDLLRRGFAFVADFDDEIPGANAKDCGNWQLHDLDGARAEARKYVEETLEEITARNLVYPVSEGC